MQTQHQQWLIAAVAALIAGGVGFYGGILYQKNLTPAWGGWPMMGGVSQGQMMGGRLNGSTGNGNRANFNPGQPNGTGQNFGRMMGGRPVVGEIIGQDDKSVTVKMQDGSSKIIILSETTRYSSASAALKSDLKVGATVNVIGTTNADGSVTAAAIELNPKLIGRQ